MYFMGFLFCFVLGLKKEGFEKMVGKQGCFYNERNRGNKLIECDICFVS